MEKRVKYNVLNGLGGWLILFGWAPLIIGGFLGIPLIFLSYIKFFSQERFYIFLEFLNLFPHLEILTYISLFLVVVDIILLIFYCVTFIQKKQIWVKIAILSILLTQINGVINKYSTLYVKAFINEESFNQDELIARIIAAATITGGTVSYLLFSKKVKITFIN